ncbi:MAG: trypsin-like serine protease [Synechococcales cyanobacterium RM1_1_8]|nr:trypsin-like serine protease [Synechococcales cyanobacterium RM1_1_8]
MRRRSWRQLATHSLALALGMLVTLGSLRVLPVLATPLDDALPPTRLAAPQQLAQQLAQRSPGASTPAPVLAAVSPTGHSFVANAVQRIGPTVVRIDTERTITRSLDPMFDDPFFRRFFGGDIAGSLPREELQRGQGSGFIIDSSGVILTNAHVVDKADTVKVTLTDGREFDGKVQGADRLTDIAVIKVNPQGKSLPAAALGNSGDIQVGDWAIAVGNPLGLNNTVTLGIVSTLSRSSSEVGISDKRLDFIQTDAAINPGNSGGPLVNASGEVIGINTAIRADAMGIGFAIPINKAREIETQLLRDGKVARPYVGIQMVSLTAQEAKENNADPNADFIVPEVDGVLVVRVLPNTPAEKAGIRRGDVITQVAGKTVTSASELQAQVEQSGIGNALRMQLRRRSQNLTITVTTAELDSQG